METLLALVLPQLVSLIFAIISAVALPKLYVWLKISTDDKRREYLETALWNGLNLGVNKLVGVDPTAEQISALKAQIIATAAEYAKAGVPDALKALKITDEHLLTLLEARLPVLIEQAAKAAA